MANGEAEPERSEEGDGDSIRVNRILNSQFQHSHSTTTAHRMFIHPVVFSKITIWQLSLSASARSPRSQLHQPRMKVAI